MARWLLFWHSVRYTRPRQLWHRLRLVLKRHAMERLGSSSFIRHSLPSAPRRLPDLPHPLFPPREKYLVHHEDELKLAYLGRHESLAVPRQWHPPELEHGTRLEKLTLHYMEYLEVLNDQQFAAIVEDWIDQNPPYRRGYWLDNWNSYALSIRCVVWMQQLALREDSLPIEFREKVDQSLAAQIEFLSRNLEVDIEGNHLIKNIKALLWAGRYFGGKASRRWQRLGERQLSKQLREQILPDGMQFERSPAYHAQVFADLLECLQVTPNDAAVKPSLHKCLSRMAQVLVNLTHPDGLVALFNDGGLHMAYRPQNCIEVYCQLGGDPVRPAEHFEMPNAGYYGLRNRDQYLLADFGPIAPDHLPGHGHGDIFSFEWDVRGERLIVGSGVFEYHPGPWRNYSRSTKAHNTVTVSDEDQCEFYGAFRVARRARVHLEEARTDEEWCVAGWHDGYRRLHGKPVHFRRIRADGSGLQVEDRVEGSGDHEVRARLLLHPKCEWHQDSTGIRLIRGAAEARLECNASLSTNEAWWMPDFGERIPTTQIVMNYGRMPCTGRFRIRIAARN